MTNLEILKQDETLKQILADSFGGVMYDVANQNKYNTSELLVKYKALSGAEREGLGGLIKGAINFIK